MSATDRHYIYVAAADVPRMRELGATIGIEDDAGKVLVKLRADRVEDLPELPKSAERINQVALTGVRLVVELRSAGKRAEVDEKLRASATKEQVR